MHFRRYLSFSILLMLWAICLSCGANYRLPIIQIPGNPGDPKLYHFAMTISTDNSNGVNSPGSTMQIDVSGDVNVGQAPLGRGPVHAALLPGGANNRIYTANAVENTVSTFTAAQLCGGASICPMGAMSTITIPLAYTPSFLHSTEALNMYVILTPVDPIATKPSIGVIDALRQVLALQIDLPSGSDPEWMAEIPNGHKLYVLDKANSLVYVIDTASRQIVQTLTVGSGPLMATTSPDSSAVFVLGSAGVTVIDANTDTILNSTPLPIPGTADSILYDNKLNRLYFTDKQGDLEIYDTAVAPGNLPVPIKALQIPAVTSRCASGSTCMLNGVTALPDGSRIYALSMAFDSTAKTWTPTLAWIDSLSLTVDPLNQTTMEPAPEAPSPCSTTRFRFQVGSSGGSERVYVSSCDFQGTYILRTFDNTEVQPVPSPLSAVQPPPQQPPLPPAFQNPVFMITGR